MGTMSSHSFFLGGVVPFKDKSIPITEHHNLNDTKER